MPATCPLCGARRVPCSRRFGLAPHLRGDAKALGLCPASDGTLRRAMDLADRDPKAKTKE